MKLTLSRQVGDQEFAVGGCRQGDRSDIGYCHAGAGLNRFAVGVNFAGHDNQIGLAAATERVFDRLPIQHGRAEQGRVGVDWQGGGMAGLA